MKSLYLRLKPRFLKKSLKQQILPLLRQRKSFLKKPPRRLKYLQKLDLTLPLKQQLIQQ